MFTYICTTWLSSKQVEVDGEPVTTIQDCVSTFVRMKPMDIFKKEASGDLPAVFVVNKSRIAFISCHLQVEIPISRVYH